LKIVCLSARLWHVTQPGSAIVAIPTNAKDTPPKQNTKANKTRTTKKPDRELFLIITNRIRFSGRERTYSANNQPLADVMSETLKLRAIHHHAATADFAVANDFALLLDRRRSADRTND
jgi:hypothetical protein